VGKYSPSATIPCQACPAGSITDTLAHAGATACTTCGVGQYSTESTVTCQVCPAGSVVDTLANASATTCTACQAGMYSAVSTVACAPCLAGSVVDALARTGATTCTTCEVGQFSTSSTVACQTCAPGRSALSGSSSCTSCVELYGHSCGTHGDCTGEGGACQCTDYYTGDLCELDPCHDADRRCNHDQWCVMKESYLYQPMYANDMYGYNWKSGGCQPGEAQIKAGPRPGSCLEMCCSGIECNCRFYGRYYGAVDIPILGCLDHDGDYDRTTCGGGVCCT
jgi:hypothetical protein